jgi:hypothetical protein
MYYSEFHVFVGIITCRLDFESSIIPLSRFMT